MLLLALAGQADTLSGRGSGVQEGDTLTVLVNGREPAKTLLAEIDTPERDQPFG